MILDIQHQIFKFISSQKSLLSLRTTCKYLNQQIRLLLSRRLKLLLISVPGEIENDITRSFIDQGNNFIDCASFGELIILRGQLKNLNFNILQIRKAFIRLAKYPSSEIFLRTIKIGSSPAAYPMDDLALFICPEIRKALGTICKSKLRNSGICVPPSFIDDLVTASYHLDDPVETIKQFLSVVSAKFLSLGQMFVAVIAALNKDMTFEQFNTWMQCYCNHPLFIEDTYDIRHLIGLIINYEPFYDIQKFSTSESVLLSTTMIDSQILARRLPLLLKWKSLFPQHADDILWECQGPGLFHMMKLNDQQFEALMKTNPHPSDIYDTSFLCQYLSPNQIRNRGCNERHPVSTTFLFPAHVYIYRGWFDKHSKAKFFSFQQYCVVRNHRVLNHPLFSMFSHQKLKILKKSIKEQFDGYRNVSYWLVPLESFIADIMLMPDCLLKKIQIPAEINNESMIF